SGARSRGGRAGAGCTLAQRRGRGIRCQPQHRCQPDCYQHGTPSSIAADSAYFSWSPSLPEVAGFGAGGALSSLPSLGACWFAGTTVLERSLELGFELGFPFAFCFALAGAAVEEALSLALALLLARWASGGDARASPSASLEADLLADAGGGFAAGSGLFSALRRCSFGSRCWRRCCFSIRLLASLMYCSTRSSLPPFCRY